MLERPTISLCMIVKDEEEMLARCLESVKDFVDEIVVVDTGSSDRTCQIAESYGAAVFHHPWEDDFSKHRNQSLGYARGLWFMYLDADEEIVDGTGPLIRQAAEDQEVDSITFEFVSYFAGGKRSFHTQPRLFRNDRDIHFEGRIHNRIAGVRTTRLYPIRVAHHGYNVDYEKAKKKHERRLRILSREIEEDPLNPTHHHYLAVAYSSAPDYENAAKEALLSIDLAEEAGQACSFFYAWTHFVAASSLCDLGRLKVALGVCRKGLERFPNDPDLHFTACRIFFALQSHEDLERHASAYLSFKNGTTEKPASTGILHWTTYDQEWRIHWFRAMACLRDSDRGTYEAEMAKAFASAHREADVHHASARFHMERGEYASAEAELERALEDNPQDENALFSRIELHIRAGNEEREIHGWGELLKRFPEKRDQMVQEAGRAAQENRLADGHKLLKALLSQYPDDKEIFDRMLRLGYTLLRSGERERARDALKAVLLRVPDEPAAAFALAIQDWRAGQTDSFVRLLDRVLQHLGLTADVEIHSMEEMGALFSLIGEGFLARENTDAAILSFEAALEIHCPLPNVHYGLALAFKKEGRLESSLQHLKSALMCSDDPRPLLLEMAQVYRQMGNAKAADFCLHESRRAPS